MILPSLYAIVDGVATTIACCGHVGSASGGLIVGFGYLTRPATSSLIIDFGSYVRPSIGSLVKPAACGFYFDLVVVGGRGNLARVVVGLVKLEPMSLQVDL